MPTRSTRSTKTRRQYMHPVITLHVVREERESPVRRIQSARSVVELLQPLAHRDREVLVAIHLSTKNDVLAIEEVSRGTLNQSLVHPREVFKGAMMSNAHSIILVHNHPSGDSTPSRDDVAITRRMVEAGRLLGMPLLDHVIIAGEAFTSFAEQGLLDK